MIRLPSTSNQIAILITGSATPCGLMTSGKKRMPALYVSMVWRIRRSILYQFPKQFAPVHDIGQIKEPFYIPVDNATSAIASNASNEIAPSPAGKA